MEHQVKTKIENEDEKIQIDFNNLSKEKREELKTNLLINIDVLNNHYGSKFIIPDDIDLETLYMLYTRYLGAVAYEEAANNAKLLSIDSPANFKQSSYNENQIKPYKIGITYTKTWHNKYVNILKEKCIEGLKKSSEKIEIIEHAVSGSYELISGAQYLCAKGCDSIIAIGILLKNETDHYEYVSQAVFTGLVMLQVQEKVPIINGILNCREEQQFKDRTEGNKCTAENWPIAAIEEAKNSRFYRK